MWDRLNLPKFTLALPPGEASTPPASALPVQALALPPGEASTSQATALPPGEASTSLATALPPNNREGITPSQANTPCRPLLTLTPSGPPRQVKLATQLGLPGKAIGTPQQ